MVMGVTPQEVAISAMVNWRASLHSLSFADEVVRHFRFAAAFVAAAAGGDESGLGALAG